MTRIARKYKISILCVLADKRDIIRIPLVPIKTLQTLLQKLRVIDESFETNLNWTIIMIDKILFTVCSSRIDNLEQSYA